jgi:hypothetical protein
VFLDIGKNMKWTHKLSFLLWIALCVFFQSQAFSQHRIEGKIVSEDSLTAVSGATVRVIGSKQSTSSDTSGLFSFNVEVLPVEVQISSFGYLIETVRYDEHITFLQIHLHKEDRLLDEVLINSRGKYRNRNNPAVALIQQVIEHKKDNSIQQFRPLSYDSYEKISLSLLDAPKWLTNNPITKKFGFIFENVDSSMVSEKSAIPIYLEEKSKRHYQEGSDAGSKVILLGNKSTKFDDRFVNNRNIETIFDYLYDDIDIYDSNILLLNKPFLSPIAETGPLFYQYYITDTLIRDQNKVIEMRFIPRNKEDRLFRGKLYITNDGRFAVQEANLEVLSDANVNWVESADIDLKFKRQSNGSYLPSLSDTRINFGSKEYEALSGRRYVAFDKYDFTAKPLDSVSHVANLGSEANGMNSESFWQDKRTVKLSQAEQQLYKNVDSLNNMKSFQRTLSWGMLLLTSFKSVGLFEVGPVEYMYSFNDLEGNRLRLGGRTSLKWSEKSYFEGYLAYGFKDESWKHYFGLARSLNKRQIGVYPAHYIQAIYQKDVNEPGKRMGFISGNSLVSSFTGKKRNKWLYNENIKLNHVIEFGKHIRLETSFSKLQQSPAGELEFLLAGSSNKEVNSLKASELGIELRWAPNEEFSQKNLRRVNLPNQFPIFNLGYFVGLKGLLDGQYDYQKVDADAFKRVYLSQLGFVDFKLGGGKIWGTVPYPLLHIPNANQAYSLSTDAFELLNNLEFISDRYAKLTVDYSMLGFIFNKIPYVKRLRLREVFGLRAYYGTLRPENRPENNPNTFLFPRDEEGHTSSFITKDRVPYLEYAVGMENIFKVLKVQYVKRLTYLEHPDVRKGRFQFGIAFDF